jgi:hypothetical protein
MLLTDYERGQRAAAASDGRGENFNNESRTFWDGFGDFMRDADELTGPTDTDTFDH